MEYRALQKRAAAPPRPKKHWPGPVDLKAEIDPAADEGSSVPSDRPISRR